MRRLHELLKRIMLSVGCMVCLVTASIGDSDLVSCRNYPGDVRFQGQHVALGAAGVVVDQSGTKVVAHGEVGEVFAVTKVRILSLPEGVEGSELLNVDGIVQILQRMECSRCDPSSLLGDRRGPYTYVGTRAWLTASLPANDPFEDAVRRAGVNYDLVIDSFCGVSMGEKRG